MESTIETLDLSRFRKSEGKTSIHLFTCPGPQQDWRAKRLEGPEWFVCGMGRLRVPDRYVDAFCGRVPRSVLARHYTDYSPEKLREIYDKAGLKVLL